MPKCDSTLQEQEPFAYPFLLIFGILSKYEKPQKMHQHDDIGSRDELQRLGSERFQGKSTLNK